MRLAATYRGARRNALRALHRIRAWPSMAYYGIKHKAVHWINRRVTDPVTGVKSVVSTREPVETIQVIHASLRTPLPA